MLFVTFLEMESTDGVPTKYLPSADDSASTAINVFAGLGFGNSSQTVLHVCSVCNFIIVGFFFSKQISTNGYFSFGRKLTDCCPVLFSGVSSEDYIVAPYWSDIDTSSTGRISYEVHTNVTSLSMLGAISKYIRHQEGSGFAGTWMVLAEWKDVQISSKCVV